MSHLVCYTRRMKNMKNKEHNDNVFLKEEARLLLNNDIAVTSPRSSWYGQTGNVRGIMADGRTLDVVLHKHGKEIFIDVSLVTDMALRESYNWPKQEQSLGPIANSVVKDTI